MTGTSGVVVRLKWGSSTIATDFLDLQAPRAVTVGRAKGCDFALEGALQHSLVRVEAGEVKVAPRGDEDGFALKRDESVRVDWASGLHFEVAFARVNRSAALGELGNDDLRLVNIAVVLLGVLGLFAFTADAMEEDVLADELDAPPARVVKMVTRLEEKKKSAVAAPEKKREPAKNETQVSGRQSKIAGRVTKQPAASPKTGKEVLGQLFGGPGIGGVLGNSPGLSKELRAASEGMRSAGLGGNGLALKGDGDGLGGERIGLGGLRTIGRGGDGKVPGGGPELKKETFDIPSPELGDVTACNASGCLDKGLVREVIRRNISKFKYCYERELTTAPNLEGKVAVRFAIEKNGMVRTSSVASSTANNAGLESCVAERAKLLVFPARQWNGAVIVTYPFVFARSGR